MNSLIPKIKCEYHPTDYMIELCSAEKCSSRLICPKCKETHDTTHGAFIEPLDSAWKLNFKQQINVLNEMKAEDERLYEKKVQEVDGVIQKLKDAFNSFLNEAREKIISKIPKTLTTKEEDWEVSRIELENAMKMLHENKNEKFYVDKYLDKYIHFKRKLRRFHKKRDNLREQMSFSYDQLDLAMKRIENSMDRFSRYFFQVRETASDNNEFNIKTLKVERYIDGPGDSLPRSIEFIPNKNLLVIGDKQGHLTLWDSKKFQKYSMKNAHVGYINNLKYFSKRDWLISASSDGTVRVWETAQGPSLKLVRHLKAGDKYIWGVLPLEKYNVLYTCGGEPNIKMWDLNTLEYKGCIDTGEKERMGRDIVFIEKYNLIVVGFQEGVIGLYDRTDRTEVAIINTFNRVIISCIVFLEKENLLVAGTDLGGKIGTWKLKEQPDSLYPEPEFVQEYKLGGTYAEKILAVNDEEQLLVATGSSSKIQWVNLKKNTHKSTPSTKLQDCVGYALNPIDRRLILGDYKSNKLAVLKY